MMYVAIWSHIPHADVTQFVAVDTASKGDDNDDIKIILANKSKVKPKTIKKSVTTTLKVKPTLKSNPRSASVVPKPALDHDTSLAVNISPNIDTLPEFAQSTWSTSFLPMLYSRLGSAPNPFLIDTDMVNAVQEVVDIVYPGSDYQVRVNDRIFTLVSLLPLYLVSSDQRVFQAKDRLNKKRTYFGRQGLKIVTEFFQGEAYANKPTEIAKYAKWAVRGNGPALFGKPTPINCTLKKGEDGYIVSPDFLCFVPSTHDIPSQEEDDIFESKFIIQLLALFLRSGQGSCHDYGHPVGALGMAAAGVRCSLFNQFCCSNCSIIPVRSNVPF